VPGENAFSHRKQDVEAISDTNISGDDDSDIEEDEIIQTKKKKKSGWKSSWNPEDVDDLVDIVVNSDYYQRKLIFTKTEECPNL
jgi:hypothetical protein